MQSSKNEFRMSAKEFDRIMKRALLAPAQPRHSEAAKGSFAWAARFRRLARGYERLATTLGAFHFLAFACLMIAQLFRMLA